MKLEDCRIVAQGKPGGATRFRADEELSFAGHATFEEGDPDPIVLAVNDEGRDRWVAVEKFSPEGRYNSLLLELDALPVGAHSLRLIVNKKPWDIWFNITIEAPPLQP